SVLISQIQLVRRVLKEIAREPTLLSELHELAHNKERISHIKADQGYSAIFLSNRPNPRYISLRLRVIKQYFEDEVLLQIHRSYLVNPRKALKILHGSKYKYELQLENNVILPVSRTYLPLLRDRYPHW